MRIDLQCENIEAPASLKEYITQRMSFAIGHFKDHVRWARIKVADVNGPKGGLDKRCVVMLRMRNLPDVVFAITQFDARVAVDQAADRVAQVLSRRLRRLRHDFPQAVMLPSAG